jgi:putative oxidoreductase
MIHESSIRRRLSGRLSVRNERTWPTRLHLEQPHLPFGAMARAQALDHVVAQSLRPVTLPLLRVLLGVLFVWFGGLKIAGRSPVAGLIAQTLPFGDNQLVLLSLGAAELALGVLLISGFVLRLALLAVSMHLAGTFATFAMAPGLVFSEGNPLLLTADGEFVTKNVVLIAAALVLISHSSAVAVPSPEPTLVPDPAPSEAAMTPLPDLESGLNQA